MKGTLQGLTEIEPISIIETKPIKKYKLGTKCKCLISIITRKFLCTIASSNILGIGK